MKNIFQLLFFFVVTSKISYAEDIWVETDKNGTATITCSNAKINVYTNARNIKLLKANSRFFCLEHPYATFQTLVGLWGPVRLGETRGTDKVNAILEKTKSQAFLADFIFHEISHNDFDEWVAMLGARVLNLGFVAQIDNTWHPLLGKRLAEINQIDITDQIFGVNKIKALIMITRLKAYLYAVLSDGDEKWVDGFHELIRSIDPRWIKQDNLDQETAMFFFSDIAVMNAMLYRAKIKALARKSYSADKLRELEFEIIDYYAKITDIEEYKPFVQPTTATDIVRNNKRMFLMHFCFPDIEAALYEIGRKSGNDDLHIEFMRNILAVAKTDKCVELPMPYEDYLDYLCPCPTKCLSNSVPVQRLTDDPKMEAETPKPEEK